MSEVGLGQIKEHWENELLGARKIDGVAVSPRYGTCQSSGATLDWNDDQSIIDRQGNVSLISVFPRFSQFLPVFLISVQKS